MKRILVITVLAVLLTSTAGATAAMATPAGNAHVRQFDVMSGDVSGKLTIDPTAQTFVFNGVGGTPGTMYYLSISGVEGPLGATAAAADGSIHMKGQCTATMEQLDAQPIVTIGPVARGGYTLIHQFDLWNSGWFVARIACYYSTDNGVTWKESGHTGDIIKGTQGFAHLSALGVPEGALVKIHVIVIAGKDRTGGDVFQYDSSTDARASYNIYGKTWNPQLVCTGLIN